MVGIIGCFNPENRNERQETERFKAFDYDDLIQRDKASLDIFWLRDESLENSDNLPDPDVLAQDIVEDLRAALALFKSISEGLEAETVAALDEKIALAFRKQFFLKGKYGEAVTRDKVALKLESVGGRMILPKWHAYASNSLWQSYALFE